MFSQKMIVYVIYFISYYRTVCHQLYLYFYDPLNSFSTYVSYLTQQYNNHRITTK
jgi:hypothetical protein